MSLRTFIRRHRSLCVVIILLCLLGAVRSVTWFGHYGAKQLEYNTITLPEEESLPGAGRLRIGFFADIQNNQQLFEQTVAYLEEQQPDLIIFGGDLVTATQRFMRTRWAVEGFRRLQQTAPVLAILGNHDYEKQEQVERVWQTAGITLLRNQAMDWKTPHGRIIRIIGLGDWNEGDEAPERCMKQRGDEEKPVLLLSHDPESRHLLQQYDWDLMLSGHTHGGQLGLPFTQPRRFLCFRSDMPSGNYTEKGRHFFVTRGVGAIFDMRFFCPPEVNIIDIIPSERGNH